MIVRPEPDRDSRPWWEAVRRHELTVQQCADCGRLRFPARAICNACRSRASTWTPVSGRGRVYSWIVNHQRFAPSMTEPITILAVRLDEGDDLLMYGNLTEPAEVHDGLAVEAVFTDHDDETLINWRPVRDRG
ncbi:Zn-ribbon domain-containing OB-fold protein [Actinomadura harenae]|uniref:Zn-ribbon domain-containing OB-fold protein n=1 Tax=Actinomadura harenae TaxID=2483351 RepID=A0A3M2M3N0_9ACTN|nr:OB-fold domain-containing protein [Actinomadura harenae]RMI44237.1 hypothetical protein EBO15_13905 [Actinomadura harenae]